MDGVEVAGSTRLQGVGVSPGRAAGPTVRLAAGVPEPPLRRSPVPPEESVAALTAAADAVATELRARAETVTGTAKEVLETTAQIATDPTLIKDARQRIATERVSPERALWEAAAAVAAQFEELGGYFAERVRDVHDVRDRIVARLTGVPTPGVPARTEPFILVAQDLAPADTAQLDPTVVRGLITAEGGPTSHTAILARALGIPAVVGLGEAAAQIVDSTVIVLDGGSGAVVLAPTSEEVAQASEQHEARTFSGRGATSDGHRVELLANVGEVAQAEPAAAAGAEGIGLFRTEFCFLDRDTEPSIDEQVEAYGTVLAAFAGKKVVVRTLDAGADKPMPFLNPTDEANPALGVRGFRTSWKNPDVLENQLAAIATAAAASSAEVWVMAPMVSRVGEAEEFVAACTRHGLETAGVMVEVPSAALLAGPILARAAFASIGTNDLTQYTLAADRLLGALAPLSTPWDPAVLSLIRTTCEGGQAQSRPVGVCGEAAADPALAAVLVGMGVTSLSMTPRALGDVAAVLAATSLEQCRRAATLALGTDNAEAARLTAREALPALAELGL
ncbi:phosphoenolpyruvate--protein phosphotransferase [Occultella gossypii]|uniref:Phosphoenolpyruvate-protein phosphotransferase n=1 Tax=Occultella gossypii TaxID=2800820 RepID=A0ABS7SAB0_9MICO|nr:phosphoenolpyruvate--protein phosphotransferase [Occultella gossypii]MBZ2196178.1 phosphoenolpyruvate--protein phosphotransferase [Occultella gossypii]